jgi:AP-3 complex subunit beta
MSSIRVKIIIHIVVKNIQKCVKDSSPYVRKTAAHAISKVFRFRRVLFLFFFPSNFFIEIPFFFFFLLFSLDNDRRDELIDLIQVLLGDQSTMVLGSAMATFNEVCPDRLDLIHPNYRKLCQVLADIDEWGQIAVLNTLIRYARTQFEDPNKGAVITQKSKYKLFWLICFSLFLFN